jgi:hypothetical protein
MMKGNREQAGHLFNRVFERFVKTFSIILSLRKVSEVGSSAAADLLLREYNAHLASLMTDPVERSVIRDKEQFVREGWPEKLPGKLTKQTIESATASVDAACIIFAHSVLDANALDYCRVTALAAPNEWQLDIHKKEIPLEKIMQKPIDELYRELLEKRFDRLDGDSLAKKIQVLFSKCKPPENWSPIKDYEFDLDHVKRIDRLRHDIVHEEVLGQPIPNAAEEIDYLLKTSLFLMEMVNYKYDLRPHRRPGQLTR